MRQASFKHPVLKFPTQKKRKNVYLLTENHKISPFFAFSVGEIPFFNCILQFKPTTLFMSMAAFNGKWEV